MDFKEVPKGALCHHRYAWSARVPHQWAFPLRARLWCLLLCVPW